MLHIVLARDEVVVMDMEAGIEHLGRATASAVDKLIVVVEPGRRSMDTAGHIKKLASEIGLKNIVLVGNKIRGQKDEDFLKKHLSDFEFLGFIRQDEALIEADLDGVSPYDVDSIACIEQDDTSLNQNREREKLATAPGFLKSDPEPMAA